MTTSLREAAALAVEVLHETRAMLSDRDMGHAEVGKAIAALRAALDVPAEEGQQDEPPSRKPLTDEEIDRALDAAGVGEFPSGYEYLDYEIARAVERAHGIA